MDLKWKFENDFLEFERKISVHIAVSFTASQWRTGKNLSWHRNQQHAENKAFVKEKGGPEDELGRIEHT